MPQMLPFRPSEPHYVVSSVVDGIPCSFEVRWNATDSAWYFDLYDADGVIIGANIKIVLGTYLGRRLNHDLTRKGVFLAVDLTRAGHEATLDDLGTRVVVVHYTTFEMVAKFKADADAVLDALA